MIGLCHTEEYQKRADCHILVAKNIFVTGSCPGALANYVVDPQLRQHLPLGAGKRPGA